MKLTILKTAIVLAIAAYAPIGHAAGKTEHSKQDSHIQTINYQEDVYKFYAAEGIATTVEFDKNELIKDYVMGDSAAWKVVKNGNLLALKPAGKKGSTNLTVYTDKRAYLFWVEMLPKNTPKVVYWLKVKSPEQVIATQAIKNGDKSPEMIAAELEAKKIEDRKKEIEQVKADLQNAKDERPKNKDYWISGAKELEPIAAEDDSVTTRLTFTAANPLPVAFIIEPDGTESIIDSHMEGDTMVLHRVMDKIVLRRGKLVAGITNRNVNRAAMSSPTGTVSDKVERAIKGKE